MKNEIRKLLKGSVKGAEISRQTGVSQTRISDLRNGKSDIGTLPLDQAERLVDYQRKLEEVTEAAALTSNESEQLIGVVKEELESIRLIDRYYLDFSNSEIVADYRYSYADLRLYLYRDQQIYGIDFYEVDNVKFNDEINSGTYNNLMAAVEMADNDQDRTKLKSVYYRGLVVAETYLKNMEGGYPSFASLLHSQDML